MTNNGSTVHVNKDYDPEIRLRDLRFHFLYRWRSILLVMVLCAAVLGAWQYVKVDRIHSAGELTRDEQRDAAERAEFETDLKNNRENVASLRQVVEERLAYRDNSLLMQLDPDTAWTAERTYLVTGAEGSAADAIAVYADILNGEHDATALEAAFGTQNLGYVREIAGIEIRVTENSFRVYVRAENAETAEKGLAYLEKKIGEAADKAQEAAPHTLQVIGEGTTQQYIEGLTSQKKTLIDYIRNQEALLRDAQRSLNNTLESEPSPSGDPVRRWIVAGAIFGLLGMIAVYLAKYLLRAKLERGEELTEQFGVPVLGEMNTSGARRSGKGVDGWLEKLQFRKDPKTAEQVYDNAAALVRERLDGGTLLLTGTVGEDVLNRVKEEFGKRLGETEIRVKADFPVESRAVEDVQDADNVLWVEQKHVSRTERVKRAGEMLETANAKVVGALVV